MILWNKIVSTANWVFFIIFLLLFFNSNIDKRGEGGEKTTTLCCAFSFASSRKSVHLPATIFSPQKSKSTNNKRRDVLYFSLWGLRHHHYYYYNSHSVVPSLWGIMMDSNNEDNHDSTNDCSIAPDISNEQRQYVQNIIHEIYGSTNSEHGYERKITAITNSQLDGNTLHIPSNEIVYGELGIDALIKVIEASGGIRHNDIFVDIGSGDGILVQAASLLWSHYLNKSIGIEILPSLYKRSISFQDKIKNHVAQTTPPSTTTWLESSQSSTCTTEYVLGNIYDVSSNVKNVVAGDDDSDNDDDNNKESTSKTTRNTLKDILEQTTIAVCFATTWARDLPGRKLTKLSKSLAETLPVGARIIIIDGKLTNHYDDDDDDDNDEDSMIKGTITSNENKSKRKVHFEYGGELRLYCPDTAPYSTAYLYTTTAVPTVQ